MVIYRCDGCGKIEEATVTGGQFSLRAGGPSISWHITESPTGHSQHLCDPCRKALFLEHAQKGITKSRAVPVDA